MKVHIECNPDETLITKLGFTNEQITHHQGKYRIFNRLKKSKDQIALIDEDPFSQKTLYERNLMRFRTSEGIIHCKDTSNNNIFILRGKLEDWIIWVCKKHRITLASYDLSDRPNKLHDEINQKLDKFSNLLDKLIEDNNSSLLKLKSWLHGKD